MNKEDIIDMCYEVGDKVEVKANLKPETSYNSVLFTHNMMDYVGKIVTIKSSSNERVKNQTIYKIKEDYGRYWWSESMFKDVPV